MMDGFIRRVACAMMLGLYAREMNAAVANTRLRQPQKSDTELITFLRRAEWMRDLTSELVKLVEDSTVQRKIAAGEYVYRKGDTPKYWIGVMDGLLEMSATSAGGKVTAVAAVFKGGWIDEASLPNASQGRVMVGAVAHVF